MSLFAAAAAFACTFAVHSTVAVAGAFCLCRLVRSAPLQEALWKFALLGAFASSALQLFLLGSPLFDLTALPQRLAVLVHAPTAAPSLAVAEVAAALAPPPAQAVAAAPPQIDPELVLGGTALLLAMVGIVWLARARDRLARCLQRRQPLAEGRVLAAAAMVAARLGLQQTPRLSCSDRLASPIAFGWLQPEICLPARAVALGDSELRAMLTHELSHLVRRDPSWLWLSALAQALAPWQPLLWLARRRLLHLAEVQCDAAAARHDGGIAVARCLLEVAGWHCAARQAPLGALGMAARGQALQDRVERVLRGDDAARRPSPWLLAPAAGLALAALTAAAPGASWQPTAADLPAMPLPAADAPPAATVAPDATVARSLQALEHDAAALRQQVAALHRSLGGLAADPEFAPLLQQLQLRLNRLEALRARLQTLRGVAPTPTRKNR